MPGPSSVTLLGVALAALLSLTRGTEGENRAWDLLLSVYPFRTEGRKNNNNRQDPTLSPIRGTDRSFRPRRETDEFDLSVGGIWHGQRDPTQFKVKSRINRQGHHASVGVG